MIAANELEPGHYRLVQENLVGGYFFRDGITITVTRAAFAVTLVYHRPTTLEINAVGPANEVITDTCYEIYFDDGTGSADIARGLVKQNPYDGGAYCSSDGATGTVTLTPFYPGNYVIVPIVLQSGDQFYVGPSELPVTVGAAFTQVTVHGETTGSVEIRTRVDGSDAVLTGACLNLRRFDGSGDPVVATACDGGPGDGDQTANGSILITDLPGGEFYRWEVTTPPAGYAVSRSDSSVVLIYSPTIGTVWFTAE